MRISLAAINWQLLITGGFFDWIFVHRLTSKSFNKIIRNFLMDISPFFFSTSKAKTTNQQHISMIHALYFIKRTINWTRWFVYQSRWTKTINQRSTPFLTHLSTLISPFAFPKIKLASPCQTSAPFSRVLSLNKHLCF